MANRTKDASTAAAPAESHKVQSTIDDDVQFPITVGPDTKLTILILGGPGSGKASLCMRIADEYDFTHICIGDLLRAEVQQGTSRGQQIAELMKEGSLVPSEIPLALLKEKIKDSHTKQNVVVDGYPKILQQATCFEQEVNHSCCFRCYRSTESKCMDSLRHVKTTDCMHLQVARNIDMIVYLDCPLEKMEERLLLRAQSSTRTDDKSETIQKRLETFQTQYLPLISHFETTRPRRFKNVKAGSLQKVEVFLQVASHLKEMFGLEARSVLVHKRHDCAQAVHVFILGGPGSGKGTQCKQIVRDFGFTHVSTGDLLRNEVKSGTNLGKEVETIMREGRLVPLSTTLTLLAKAINASHCKHFLIDGFPRSLEQVQAFEEKIGKPTLVLYLNCSVSTMEKRLLDRGKTSKRADDNIETIRQRFESFQKESQPVVNYYKNAKQLKEVSAEKDAEQVYKLVKEALVTLVDKDKN